MRPLHNFNFNNFKEIKNWIGRHTHPAKVWKIQAKTLNINRMRRIAASGGRMKKINRAYSTIGAIFAYPAVL